MIKRGCWHLLQDPLKSACDKSEGNCKVCRTNRCNTKDTFQSCITCNSETNANCVLMTEPEKLQTSICKDYMAECEAYVVNGHTIRDCKSSNIECIPPYCDECSSNNCNNQVVPFNRLQCYQCSGEDCAKDLTGNFNFLNYCRLYRDDEKCYTYKSGENSVVRGCISDAASECEQKGSECLTCTDSTCNKEPLERIPSLHCIKCSGGANDACSWGFESGKSELCIKPIELHQTEQCYSVKLPNGIVQRGCINDDTICSEEGVNCNVCGVSGCNNQNIEKQTCVRCHSKDVSTCSLENLNIAPQECDNPLIEFEQRGCYTSRNSEKQVIRGCFVDLTEEEQKDCTENTSDKNSKCFKCVGQGCNTGKAPNFGTTLKASVTLTLLLMIISIFH